MERPTRAGELESVADSWRAFATMWALLAGAGTIWISYRIARDTLTGEVNTAVLITGLTAGALSIALTVGLYVTTTTTLYGLSAIISRLERLEKLSTSDMPATPPSGAKRSAGGFRTPPSPPTPPRRRGTS